MFAEFISKTKENPYSSVYVVFVYFFYIRNVSILQFEILLLNDLTYHGKLKD